MKTNTKIALTAAVVSFGIIGAASACSDSDESKPTAVGTIERPAEPQSAERTTRATTPPTTAAKDPYSTDGTWLVPSEIAPGTYRAAIAPGEDTGYYAICADFACAIDMDGSNETGMIDNEFMTANGIVVIPPNAVSIEMRDIVLTPMQ